MFHDLDSSLKAILGAANSPTLVRDAEVAFDRPSDSFAPEKTTINLFLYDIRENTELRSSEPVMERLNGVVAIRRPPLRVACSYLVTAWIEAGSTGEDTLLRQHELLGEVLRVFGRLPTIPAGFLQGGLARQSYPVPLAVAQGELMRNPSEFWSALGGKLRPSLSLAATLAMDDDGEPVEAHEVSTKEIAIRETASGIGETFFEIGGTVRDAATGKPLAGAEVALPLLGLHATSNADGRFSLSAIATGTHQIRASLPGYVTGTLSVAVPGSSPTAFDINLTGTI